MKLYDSLQGASEIFIFTTRFRTVLSPTLLPIQWKLKALSPGVNQAECKYDHSLLSSEDVKNL
jgi:hypothetical protein